jgi:hypothetical protein
MLHIVRNNNVGKSMARITCSTQLHVWWGCPTARFNNIVTCLNDYRQGLDS